MLSIVIPVFNQQGMTTECIKAVQENTRDFEYIVVDNGSTPPLSINLGEGFVVPRVRNDSNLGFPVAVNQGIRAAKGDTIVLLNNDVIVTPHWSERLLAHLDRYAIVGPMTNYCAGKQKVTIPVYNDLEELSREAKGWSNTYAGQSIEVNWVIGFCMAFKRTLWEEIGPFDESLWPCSGEEIDFCLRARQRGYKVGVAKDIYVHHEGSQTFKAMEEAGMVEYQKIVKQNDAHLAEKWGADVWGRQATTPTCEGLRLNMGSGPFPMEGFINIDQFEDVNPDLVCNVTELPYEPGTVSEIYAGHILEHFTFEDGQKALRYWLSLLKPGGKISVVVPDYDFLVKEYVKNMTPDKLIEFNDTYIYSGIQPSPHQYAYSAALLERCMNEAGFSDIERMPVDHPYFPFAVDWQVGFQGVRP